MKSKRIGSGFWHRFFADGGTFFAPQNIKFELWDTLTCRIKDRWHPQLYGVLSCVFDAAGARFALLGDGDESRIKLYDAASLAELACYDLAERASNLAFDDTGAPVFGGWDGGIYRIKSGVTGERFGASPQKFILARLPSSMITLCETACVQNPCETVFGALNLIPNLGAQKLDLPHINLAFLAVQPSGKDADKPAYIGICDLKSGQLGGVSLPFSF